MAYLTSLISASENSVFNFRQNISTSIQASKVNYCSHLIAYWIKIQPLGSLLSEAIDRGKILSEIIGHPLRPPIWHDVESVKTLSNKLENTWRELIAEKGEFPDDDWGKIEIQKVLDIFQYASKNDETIISILDLNNFNTESKRRIKIPVVLKI